MYTQYKYSYTSMYTKYKYNHHTLIQVCILNINAIILLLCKYVYSYTSMCTKYKYKHHTLIQVCILKYKYTYMSTILSTIFIF